MMESKPFLSIYYFNVPYFQCWKFATGSPQVRNCGASFFIADF